MLLWPDKYYLKSKLTWEHNINCNGCKDMSKYPMILFNQDVFCPYKDLSQHYVRNILTMDKEICQTKCSEFSKRASKKGMVAEI